MKKILLLFTIFSFIQTTKSQINSELANQLQTELNNQVSNAGNNGVSAHLIMPNGETWTGTAGVNHQNTPITDSTLFHGASTTKFNVAILMLLLAEENLVNLDESWTNYISLDVSFDASITVRQLLNHTSGIADYLETATSGSEITSDFNYFYTPQYILENVVSDVPDFPVGTGFQYSNSNYVLAGLIIEAITGNPIQVELQNRRWSPLNMNHTYFGAYDIYTEPTAGVWWNFGSGVTNYSDMPTTSMLSFAYGAGNIVSCPTDLAILLNAVLNNQVLSPESLDEMLTFVPNSFGSWTAGYGLGIHHQFGQMEDTVLGHDGYHSNLTDMFHSMDYGFTLVTMTNTQTEWFAIYNSMYDILKTHFMTSDVKEIEPKFDLTIYPNPTKNQFIISCSQIIEDVEIKDILGKIIYLKKANSKSISLNLEANGLYFVTINSNKQSLTKKLVIEKI